MIPIQHFNFDGYAFEIKEVKTSGNSGRVFVPKTWEGKKVVVILLEPPIFDSEDADPIPQTPEIFTTCPGCKQSIPLSAKYCPECGLNLQREEVEVFDHLPNSVKKTLRIKKDIDK